MKRKHPISGMPKLCELCHNWGGVQLAITVAVAITVAITVAVAVAESIRLKNVFNNN